MTRTTTTPPPATAPALAFVYLSGAEVYAHPAEVQVADARTVAHYGIECQAECGTPVLGGQVILTTDATTMGEWTGHLACAIATGGHLTTLAEAEEMQEQDGMRHAAP